jgi:hypothetical protein
MAARKPPSPSQTGGSGDTSRSVGVSGGMQISRVTTTTLSAGTGAIPVHTTRPKILLRHDISDDDLQKLEDGNRGGLSEAFWAFVAAALVALPSAVEGLYNAYIHEHREPLTILRLIDLLVFVMCTALAITLYVISHGRKSDVTKLVQEIRGRSTSDVERTETQRR